MTLLPTYKLKLISETIIAYGYMEHRVNLVDFNERRLNSWQWNRQDHVAFYCLTPNNQNQRSRQKMTIRYFSVHSQVFCYQKQRFNSFNASVRSCYGILLYLLGKRNVWVIHFKAFDITTGYIAMKIKICLPLCIVWLHKHLLITMQCLL